VFKRATDGGSSRESFKIAHDIFKEHYNNLTAFIVQDKNV